MCNGRKDQWDEFLESPVFAYCICICIFACLESTNYSPFEVMFGRKPTLPVDLNMNATETTGFSRYIN